MIFRTIERLRSARAWIVDPTRLIDRLLDELDKLSGVLLVPARDAGLSRSQAGIEARFD